MVALPALILNDMVQLLRLCETLDSAALSSHVTLLRSNN